MKKNLLLRLCLILMVALTISSCRTDHLPENETAYDNSSKFQLTSKRISLNESKHKEKLVTELNKVEAQFKKLSKTNTNGRVIDYENGVSIDTDEVIYIENGPNFHTYTFHIKRENALPEDPLENLVLCPLTDGSYKELLFSYNLSASEKQTMMNGGFVNTKGKVTITELAQGTYNNGNLTNKASCGYQEESIFVTVCSENQHGLWNVESWGDCSADRKPGLYITTVYRCNFIYDDNLPGGGWWAGEGGGGDSGGGDSGNQNPGNGTTNPCNDPAANPLDPNTNLGEGGGCSGIPSQPNLPLPNRTTPCKILKDNDAIPELKHKMDSLKLRVTQANPDKHETLVVITKEEPSGELIYNTYVAPTSGNGYIGVSGQGTNNDVADIHNHPPNTIPIFAFGDIVNIYDSYKFLYPNRKQVFVSYLVNFNGTTYAIKINDTTALDALFAGMNIGTATTTKAQRKLANDKVEAIFKKHGMDNEKTYNQADAEKLFMDVINNPIIGAGSGVHIYRKDNDGWGKLNMDSNGNITKENCPL